MTTQQPTVSHDCKVLMLDLWVSTQMLFWNKIFKGANNMRTLIELTKDKPRVFIVLKTPHAKAEFLKQASAEGFVLGDKLPENCKCNNVMIIHSNYTMNYCVGMAANMCLNHSVSVDYEKYMDGSDDYLIGVK